MSGSHINAEGKFQSDRYPSCPAGKVPLSVTDKTAMDLLWEYAQRRRVVDAEFSADLETCLLKAEFVAPVRPTRAGGPPGEDGCPLCGEPSVIVRVGPGIVREQYKAFCTSPPCANARSKRQSTDADQRPATSEPATPPPRSRDRDKAKLAEALERIVTLGRELSGANDTIEALQSDVAARQIRETDLAARLLKSERSLLESGRIIERQTDELQRRRP